MKQNKMNNYDFLHFHSISSQERSLEMTHLCEFFGEVGKISVLGINC